MRVQFYKGGLVATLLAGPLFILMVGLATIMIDPTRAIELSLDPQSIIRVLPVIAAAAVFGALLAIMPVWIGGSLMGWAAARNPGLAHPAIWALSGGGICAAVSADFDSALGLALIATGAICATIVRYGTRWSDDDAPTTPHAISACPVK